MSPLVTTEKELINIPQSLYPACNKTPFTGKTIGDRLLWSEQLNKQYNICISDVEILIEHIEQLKGEDDG